MDRAALRTHLENLDAAVPALLKSSPDRCHFWQAFAGMADVIEDGAITADDAQFVLRRVDEILAWHGLEDPDRDC
ncbi:MULTISPECIES: hypothetical protein [Xanthomonas]|uniref:Uncharacterized protein n=2 Tax=Xanthomonas citri TaxID=346 RepID=A0AB33CDC7_XANCI|nr:MULTISPECIES: hypothetical protein [Xanthomonas]MBV6782232.1 hypothetical protein [Xanthomonas campestris pv. trichodesmae]OOW88529.1 hypothetical protein Xvtf_12475 [Xanthomonas campestris pv. vitistrifoliae]ASK90544.1 hypothetical protein XcvCFBP7111P_02620 [Xanthomonas citri pv. vignicola]MBZ3921911.1 hypothetical protein [Xanthomonas campestris pv. trichodesmae]MBZ3926575.1 hypothetical protein [Xanthomonas citri pv. sesbaniae]